MVIVVWGAIVVAAVGSTVWSWRRAKTRNARLAATGVYDGTAGTLAGSPHLHSSVAIETAISAQPPPIP